MWGPMPWEQPQSWWAGERQCCVYTEHKLSVKQTVNLGALLLEGRLTGQGPRGEVRTVMGGPWTWMTTVLTPRKEIVLNTSCHLGS